MPRIAPWLLRRASQHSANTAALLPACRDLRSAINELRWIREHVDDTVTALPRKRGQLSWLCKQRGRGVPLQYILGSQPFGSLDIKCRPGVLIPRPETEAYTCHLVELIRTGRLLGSHQGLNIVDFCTGTGCIPLLLFASLQQHVSHLNVLGVDVSPRAVGLAEENIVHNIRSGHLSRLRSGQSLEISRGDIFQDGDIQKLTGRRWDVMVSNPPYISRRVWDYGRGQLGYSVRKYEPSLALVPGNHLPVPLGWEHEDVFYSRLLDIAHQLRPKVLLLEIGDEDQACRVLTRFSRHSLSGNSHVEIWRDWPDLAPSGGEDSLNIKKENGQSWRVPTKGGGQVRSVFIRTL